MPEITIPMSSVIERVTLTFRFTGVARAAMRLTLASWLFLLGGWIGGLSVNVVIE